MKKNSKNKKSYKKEVKEPVVKPEEDLINVNSTQELSSHKSTQETVNTNDDDVTKQTEKTQDKTIDTTLDPTLEKLSDLHKPFHLKESSSRRSEGDTHSLTMSNLRADSLLQAAKKETFSPTHSQNDTLSNYFHRSHSGTFTISSEVIVSDKNSERGDSPKVLIPKSCAPHQNNNKSKDSSLILSLDKGNLHRHTANALFKKNKFKEALSEYLLAIDELNSLIENNQKSSSLNITSINWVRMECLNNISVCYLLLKDYSKVLDYTKQGLQINPKSFIALSYRAKALKALSLDTEALEVIRLALSVKYSKTLMNLMKDSEEKILAERRKSGEDIKIDLEGSLGLENINLEEEFDGSGSNYTTIKNEDKNKKGKESFWSSLLKLLKIMSFSVFNFAKKYKFFIVLALLLYVGIFRRRLKTKLLDFLRIKFI